MAKHRRGRLLQNGLTLILLGLLAGAIGGLGVGIITGRTGSSTSSTTQ